MGGGQTPTGFGIAARQASILNVISWKPRGPDGDADRTRPPLPLCRQSTGYAEKFGGGAGIARVRGEVYSSFERRIGSDKGGT